MPHFLCLYSQEAQFSGSPASHLSFPGTSEAPLSLRVPRRALFTPDPHLGQGQDHWHVPTIHLLALPGPWVRALHSGGPGVDARFTLAVGLCACHTGCREGLGDGRLVWSAWRRATVPKPWEYVSPALFFMLTKNSRRQPWAAHALPSRPLGQSFCSQLSCLWNKLSSSSHPHPTPGLSGNRSLPPRP